MLDDRLLDLNILRLHRMSGQVALIRLCQLLDIMNQAVLQIIADVLVLLGQLLPFWLFVKVIAVELVDRLDVGPILQGAGPVRLIRNDLPQELLAGVCLRDLQLHVLLVCGVELLQQLFPHIHRAVIERGLGNGRLLDGLFENSINPFVRRGGALCDTKLLHVRELLLIQLG